MRLLDKYVRRTILYGIALLHILVLSLSAFFIYRFVYLLNDNSGYVLPVAFLLALLYIDIGLYKGDMHKKIFGKATFDKEYISCSCLSEKWKINYKEICIYGVVGSSIFLSIDCNEKDDLHTKVSINKKRIVIEAREEVLEKIEEFLPQEMTWRINRAIDNKADCYYKKR